MGRRLSDASLRSLTRVVLLFAVAVTSGLLLYGTSAELNPLLIPWACAALCTDDIRYE
jgi:hypothetical protein